MEEGQGSPPGAADEQLGPPPQEGAQPVEETEEQQKIKAIFNKVSEVNAELDGGLVHQVPTADGSTTLLFAAAHKESIILPDGSFDKDRGTAFGVNSLKGPILFSAALNRQFLGPRSFTTHVPENFEGGIEDVDEDDLLSVSINVLPAWGETFEVSKRLVLDNKERMEKIRADRIAYLNQALEIVSRPVIIDATLPPPEA